MSQQGVVYTMHKIIASIFYKFFNNLLRHRKPGDRPPGFTYLYSGFLMNSVKGIGNILLRCFGKKTYHHYADKAYRKSDRQ